MEVGTEKVGIQKKNLIVSATVVLMSISGREKNRHEFVDGAQNEKMEFFSLLEGVL